MKIVVCIPARYASTRFPGKVLAKETGKYLIQHTYEQASKAALAGQVIIAADDEKIVTAAAEFSGRCVLTSPDHQSGTDRIAEVVADLDVDIVINVQGDEPEIDPAHIDYVARLLIENPEAPMATLAARFTSKDQIADPNVVKVIVTTADSNAARAIYFSRSVIPYDRDSAGVGDVSHYLRHLGIYAYRKDLLLRITQLPQTPLEKLEKLEQLRVIEHGYPILVGTVEHPCEGIDTPEQYAAFVKRYRVQDQTDMTTEIRDTISRWFDDTISQIQMQKGESLVRIAPMVIEVLRCGKEHCASVLCLVANSHATAGAAILRVLLELDVKLNWCLQAPGKETDSNSDNRRQRFQRWNYTRAKELRKRCCDQNDPKVGEATSRLDCLIKNCENQGLKELPRVAQMCDTLSQDPNENWQKAYSGIYRRFSREVHGGMSLVRKSLEVSDAQALCLSEPVGYHERELLAYCIVGGFRINRAVRACYDLDCCQMQREGDDLLGGIAQADENGA